MRTKTLVLSAIVGALSSASLMAQVYSLNAVGYINVTVPPGFSIIANQLNTTNNNISPLLDAQVGDGNHDGDTIFKFNGSGYAVLNIDSRSVPPYDGADATHTTLNPGEGIFYYNGSGATETLTFVGTVLQGSLTNTIPSGFSILSSQVPQAGALDSALGITEQDSDTVFLFSNATGGYVVYNGDSRSTPPWDGGPNGAAPTVTVGQAFFYYNGSGAAEPWVRSFSVN